MELDTLHINSRITAQMRNTFEINNCKTFRAFCLLCHKLIEIVQKHQQKRRKGSQQALLNEAGFPQIFKKDKLKKSPNHIRKQKKFLLMLKEQKGNLKARFTGVISESETAQLKFKEIKNKKLANRAIYHKRCIISYGVSCPQIIAF